MDRRVAADLVVLLEAVINSAGEGAWFMPSASAAQAAVQQALLTDDVFNAHQRAARRVAPTSLQVDAEDRSVKGRTLS